MNLLRRCLPLIVCLLLCGGCKSDQEIAVERDRANAEMASKQRKIAQDHALTDACPGFGTLSEEQIGPASFGDILYVRLSGNVVEVPAWTARGTLQIEHHDGNTVRPLSKFLEAYKSACGVDKPPFYNSIPAVAVIDLVGGMAEDQYLDLSDSSKLEDLTMAYFNTAENPSIDRQFQVLYEGDSFSLNREAPKWAKIRSYKYFLLPAVYFYDDYKFSEKAFLLGIKDDEYFNAELSSPVLFKIEPQEAERISRDHLDPNIKNIRAFIFAELDSARIETVQTKKCFGLPECFDRWEERRAVFWTSDPGEHGLVRRPNYECRASLKLCENMRGTRSVVKKTLKFKALRYLVSWDGSPMYKNY